MPQKGFVPSLHRPSIDYTDARFSYFIVNGTQIHSIKDAPAEIFREVVLQALGKRKLHESCKEFMKSDREKLDMTARWYLLNSLCEVGKPLKLYRCFEDAEKAIEDVVS